MGKRSPERVDFLQGVFITAMEGGVDYWADVTDYSPDGGFEWDEDAGGGRLIDPRDPTKFYALLIDMEDEDEEFLVNINTIAKGFGLVKDPDVRIRDRKRLLEAYREMDAGYIDAGDADSIVQLGLFGEIVFG